jgi:hypothetical protein
MRIVPRAQALYARSGIGAILPMPAKLALRRAWARLAFHAGHPVSSPLFSQPRLRAGRRPFRLTHVLLASDLNPRYVECWPLARRAWREIVGVDAILVLVGAEADAPADLLADDRVSLFAPLEGVPTSLQAQCVRLLYPALLELDGCVIVSDMELMPLSSPYFRGSVEHLDERMFVSYRDVLFYRGQMAIAYNAARPETWASVFDVSTADDVRARLAEWTTPIEYDGVRGGAGWYTDQHVLFRTLEAWPERNDRHWVLDDAYTGFRRLDRHDVAESGLSRRQARDVGRGRYTDFDSLVPHTEFGAVNDSVIRLAAGER